ncbi:hypothetical protein ACFU44_20230 [Nocardia rhizosphaerihabitans]|uniref:hypothetical protein n=1 Tax=Nocardia rhizosphaerihabitans TaxID=1691570 RepID=UPI00366D59A1
MARYTNTAITDGVDDTLNCHVTVYFYRPDPQPMILEYLATWPEAAEFAAAAQQFGLLVTIDGQVKPGLRQLPCRTLWH